VLELADLGGRVDHTVFAVGPVDGPLVSLRIVKTYGQALDQSAGAVQLNLLDVARAIPDLVGVQGTVERNPLFRAGQRMLEPGEVNFPAPHGEIEIVLAVPLGRGAGGSGLCQGRGTG